MKYRPEVDGLRTVAVVPVILFHAGIAGFDGGFVGVDVFFVISGFLITTILIDELERGDFSILRFYERRARRILPALFFVMALCVPVAWAWMLPEPFADFAASIVAVCFFVSNILFWRQDDYFAPVAEEKPLLHTWSLAVEEQYYVVFPLVLMLLWVLGRRQVGWLVGLGMLASFALMEYARLGMDLSTKTIFYLTPFRAWELLAGALCAFRAGGVGPRPNHTLSALGLALILGAVLLFDTTTPFPSIYTLIPVLGSCLILLHATPATWAGRILATSPLVGIGLISYSAYLWHQPLLAFARVHSLTDPAPALMLSLSALSLGLAYLTWRFVEQPFRHRGHLPLPTRKAVFTVSILASVCFIAVGGYIYRADGMRAMWMVRNADNADVLAFLNYDGSEQFKYQFSPRPGCFFSGNSGRLAQYDQSICLTPTSERPNYLLVGDSHAAHLAAALSEHFSSANLMQATVSGCRPLIDGSGAVPCLELHDQVFELLDSQGGDIDAVFLSARWQENEVEAFAQTLHWLAARNIPTIIIGPMVEYATDFPLVLAKVRAGGGGQTNHMADETVWKIEDQIRPLVEAHGMPYVSMLLSLCPEGACVNESRAGEPMLFDKDHLTLSGARDFVTHSLPADPTSMLDRAESGI